MKKQRRWMQSVVEASKTETTVLPFQRQYRRMKTSTTPRMSLPRSA